MATKVTMPQLGESVIEGTIGKWLVEKGQKINKYDPLCEVMTDKVNAEVPATFSGTITEIVAQEDETVKVGAIICYIEEEGSESSVVGKPSAEMIKDVEGIGATLRAQGSADQSIKKRYSPAVLKLAAEHQIDLEQVNGSGKGGRITRKDILTIIESGQIPKETAGTDSSQSMSETQQREQMKAAKSSTEKLEVPIDPPPTTLAHLSLAPGDVEIPVVGVRKAIAHKMMQSKHEAPHAWTMVEVDVTGLVNYRSKVKDQFKLKEGINLTFFPFFMKATVEALREYPIINSHWAGDKIIQKKDINLAFAVATDDALYTPVIRNADERSIMGMARSVHELAHKTRSGKLSTEDLQGGTFTINNPGSFGSIQSAPIINYPQAAILNVEAIVKRPVIKDGMIAIRDIVNLCLSLDHRILDGLVCGRFLQSIKGKLEAIDEGTGLY